MAGTASTVSAFVVLECPGPWGVDALRDSRLPDRVKSYLQSLARSGVRPLLARRPAQDSAGGVRVFAAVAGSRQARPTVGAARPTVGAAPPTDGDARPAAAGAQLWSGTLDDVLEVLALDFGGLRDGVPPAGLSVDPDPLLLVCTHGKHDACCAEWGRPLATALRAAAPDLVWEVSHVGGDRFAPNLLALPDGLYYGRLEPADADRFVADHLGGRLDLDHLRGRTIYPFAVQAAEIHLRRHLGDRTRAPYELLVHTRAEDPGGGVQTTVVFDVGGMAWQARVRTSRAPAQRLTCRARRDDAAPVHELLDLQPAAEARPAP